MVFSDLDKSLQPTHSWTQPWLHLNLSLLCYNRWYDISGRPWMRQPWKMLRCLALLPCDLPGSMPSQEDHDLYPQVAVGRLTSQW